MKAISIKKDIVPLSEFKTNLSKMFKSLQNEEHPLIITQNGKPAGVLLSPENYDELVYRKSFLDSVGKGIADAERGRMDSTSKLKAALSSRRTRE